MISSLKYNLSVTLLLIIRIANILFVLAVRMAQGEFY